MKMVMILGIVLLLVGAGLMVVGYVSYRDTDPVVNIGKLEITKTSTKRKPIPVAVTGTLMGVGAVLTIVGAVQRGK